MDPITTGAIAGFLAARGSTALDELAKPMLQAAGEDLLSRFRTWRARNAAEVVYEAEAMAKDGGYKLQPVPGRILMPILEHSSMEEDPDMRRMWSALLANAASKKGETRQVPGFSDILRQLTPTQASILQWMFDMGDYDRSGLPPYWPDVQRRHLEVKFDLSGAEYALLIADMDRMQLIEGRRTLDTEGLDTSAILPLITARWNSRVKYDEIGLTPLGLQFMQACTPPVIKSKKQRQKK